MARISTEESGNYRVQFRFHGLSHTVRLGVKQKFIAEIAKRNIETLIASQEHGVSVPADVMVWLTGLSLKVQQRIARSGLTEPPAEQQQAMLYLSDLTRAAQERYQSGAASTLNKILGACRDLEAFFLPKTLLKSITHGDAIDFRKWLTSDQRRKSHGYKKRLAVSTANGVCKKCRTIFQIAVDKKLLDINPISGLPGISNDSNDARKFFVTRDLFQTLLSKADPDLTTALTLIRFNGLRAPDEVIYLKWDHIDWDQETITATTPKKEYTGNYIRQLPIFPDVLPYLQDAYERSEPGQEYVVPGLKRQERDRTLYRRTLRAAYRAGLTSDSTKPPWPKVLVNMRASCETEMLRIRPLTVVAKWFGHSPKVAATYYAQVTDTDRNFSGDELEKLRESKLSKSKRRPKQKKSRS